LAEILHNSSENVFYDLGYSVFWQFWQTEVNWPVK